LDVASITKIGASFQQRGLVQSVGMTTGFTPVPW
jgi:hypothetical protein